MSQAPGKRTTMSHGPAKQRKPKAARLPFALMPHACSVLGVDPATRSGWSLWSWGRLVTYGECDVFGGVPRQVLAQLIALPGPHVVAVERPFLIRFGGQSALGTGDRIWREHASRIRPKLLTIVRVYPATWRSRVLPKGMHAAARDDVQREERATARLDVIAHLGPHVTELAPRIGAESAPAILIGKWASFAGETLAALDKQPKKKRTKGAA